MTGFAGVVCVAGLGGATWTVGAGFVVVVVTGVLAGVVVVSTSALAPAAFEPDC